MKIDRRKLLAALAGTAALPVLGSRARSTPDPVGAASPARLAQDPRRPQYHLLPPRNWMNDPNGPIYWNGQHHMFYQYNPDGAYWGNMHWGHAVSPDMVHWRHLPVALAPTPGSPDEDGCFTGTAIVQNGRVTILYTGVRAASPGDATNQDSAPPLRETQCLAVARDAGLISWEKAVAPVIDAPPPGMEVNGFRDPSPWRQGEWWYTVLGSGIAGDGGAVLLYRSRDLRHWEYMHILAHREHDAAFDPRETWECPEFFPLGDRHILIYSAGGKARWQAGRLDTEAMVFHAEQAGILDYGCYYASKSQLDKHGNRILWGWLTEARPLEEYKAAGWAGMMSLPRVLSLAANGCLRFRVAEEANQLRNRAQILNLNADEDQNLHQLQSMRIEGCCGEVLCVARRSTDPYALSLHGSSQNLTPWLKLSYDPLHPGQIWIDDRPLPIDFNAEENLVLHLYVDGSVIEAFVNHQVACTRRFYLKDDTPLDLCMKWTGRTANLVSISAWQLSPISTNRLTT